MMDQLGSAAEVLLAGMNWAFSEFMEVGELLGYYVLNHCL